MKIGGKERVATARPRGMRIEANGQTEHSAIGVRFAAVSNRTILQPARVFHARVSNISRATRPIRLVYSALLRRFTVGASLFRLMLFSVFGNFRTVIVGMHASNAKAPNHCCIVRFCCYLFACPQTMR